VTSITPSYLWVLLFKKTLGFFIKEYKDNVHLIIASFAEKLSVTALECMPSAVLWNAQ
jgi:hypothetical protein